PDSLHLHHLHPFPTRRSSDLPALGHAAFSSARHREGANRVVLAHDGERHRLALHRPPVADGRGPGLVVPDGPAVLRLVHSLDLEDRKSTRLNSSHLGISYAVF